MGCLSVEFVFESWLAFFALSFEFSGMYSNGWLNEWADF